MLMILKSAAGRLGMGVPGRPVSGVTDPAKAMFAAAEADFQTDPRHRSGEKRRQIIRRLLLEIELQERQQILELRGLALPALALFTAFVAGAFNVLMASVEMVLVVDDPDAPGGSFTHWLVAGLPPAEGSLDGALPPEAVEGTTDFDQVGWGGPCPPAGDEPHTYVFEVVAVAEATGLEAGFTASDLEDAVAGTELSAGTLTGRYGR